MKNLIKLSDKKTDSGNERNVLLPALRLEQLIDISTGITVLLKHCSYSQSAELTNPGIPKEEWSALSELLDFKNEIEYEIKRRIPSDQLEINLNETPD